MKTGTRASLRSGTASQRPPLPVASPLPLLLPERQDGAHDLVLGERGVRCGGAPGRSLGDSRTPTLRATHQLLGSCVLDEPRAVAGPPGARDPHPWAGQGRGDFGMGDAGRHAAPGWACPSCRAPLAGLCPRRAHSAGLASAPRSSGTGGPGRKGPGSGGPGLPPGLVSRPRRDPPPKPCSHQGLRSL